MDEKELRANIKKAMNALNEFAENNYKNGKDLAVQAEYSVLYMEFLRIIDAAHEAGFSIPHIDNKSNLSEEETDEMLAWETEMVDKVTALILSKGFPEKN